MSPIEFNRWLSNKNRPPLVMGVLNVTPDSFSDGGKFAAPESAIAHAHRMIADGADLIDIGGESTRPGAARVPGDEQIRRVLPVIERLGTAGITLSIDTTRVDVARAALDAGAALVNDISAGTDDPSMLPLVANRGCPIAIMHMQGTPETMQQRPQYGDVMTEVRDYLKSRIDAFIAAGVAPRNIIIDPGIGFGKTVAHNLLLLKHLSSFITIGHPVLVGVSRKSFLGKIAGITTTDQTIWPTAAAVGWCVAAGASIVRVHDVAEMKPVVRVVRAISDAS